MNMQSGVWNKIERIIRIILLFCFRMIHKELKEDVFQTLMQFVKFGIIGVTNTLISYVLNVLSLLLLQPLHVSWDFIAGNIVAFILSVLWSFYWNNRYVFISEEGKSRNLWKTLLKTYIAYGFTGIILSNVLSWIWISVFGISKYVAPLINLVVSVPLNFVINKLWAFKE